MQASRVSVKLALEAGVVARVEEMAAALGQPVRTVVQDLVSEIVASAGADHLHVAEHLSDELRLLMLMRSGAKRQAERATNELIAAWHRRVMAVVRAYAGRDFANDDLRMAGVLGLLEAAQRWRLGAGWATYATSWIKKAIQRWVRHNGCIVMQTESEMRRGGRRHRGWAALPGEGNRDGGNDEYTALPDAMVEAREVEQAAAHAVDARRRVYPLAAIALARRAGGQVG